LISALLTVLAVILVIIALSTDRKVATLKKRYGIPGGRITYTDLDKPAKALFSRNHGVAGKPDCIVKKNGELIPVEVKSGKNPGTPYRSHIMQLATYCMLVEENFRTNVPYGVVVYGDGSQHKIAFTEELRNEVLGVISRMRHELKSKTIDRNHGSSRRCTSCSYNYVCEDKLV